MSIGHLKNGKVFVTVQPSTKWKGRLYKFTCNRLNFYFGVGGAPIKPQTGVAGGNE